MGKSRVPGSRSTNQVRSEMGLGSSDDGDFQSTPESPQEVKVAPQVKEFERTFTKTKKIVSDVFKLTVAEVLKQVGAEKNPDKDPDSFRPFEHTHVFRTFDSDGKRHARCCSTAGHFHEIEWDYSEEGKPEIKSVSGPMNMSKKQVRGKWTQVAVPANHYDDHTHDFEYLNSVEVQARTTNIEAQKVIAISAQRGAPVSGVVER